MKENETSSTALTVLQGLMYTSKQPEFAHLVSTEAIKAAHDILSTTDAGKKRLKHLESVWYCRLVPIIQKILMPGITLHYALRKRFIEDIVLSAIENDHITQIINLGAGFDTLAWRLHSRYSYVQFIEIDHPATNRLKSEALQQAKNEANNLHWLSVDFTQQSLKEALGSDTQFDSQKKTLFICEGVLMYLNQDDVIKLFSEIKQLTGKGTQSVFSCVEPMNSKKNNTGALLKAYLRFKGEALNWFIEENRVTGFMQQQNYVVRQIGNSETFKQKYLQDTSPLMHKGEYIIVAEIQ